MVYWYGLLIKKHSNSSQRLKQIEFTKDTFKSITYTYKWRFTINNQGYDQRKEKKYMIWIPSGISFKMQLPHLYSKPFPYFSLNCLGHLVMSSSIKLFSDLMDYLLSELSANKSSSTTRTYIQCIGAIRYSIGWFVCLTRLLQSNLSTATPQGKQKMCLL